MFVHYHIINTTVWIWVKCVKGVLIKVSTILCSCKLPMCALPVFSEGCSKAIAKISTCSKMGYTPQDAMGQGPPTRCTLAPLAPKINSEGCLKNSVTCWAAFQIQSYHPC